MLRLPLSSDVKFHEFFWREIFREIFKKIHDVFLGQYTHPFNIFDMSNITFHSFMHTAAPLTSYTVIMFLKVLSHFIMTLKYFKERVLKYFKKISMKFLNISK